MTEDQRRRLRSLLTANGDGNSSAVAEICALAVAELAVSGVWVTLISQAGTPATQQRLVRATDATAARLEELQFTVGEGPGLEAVISGTAILAPDLIVTASRWPAFTSGAQAAGAAAVFAFPLSLGAIRLGSLDCYRTTAGQLSSRQTAAALILAEMTFEAVLSETAGHAHDDLGWITDIHAEVHQATGIVKYDLGVTMQAALLRIRGYAYANDMPIAVVAQRIVDRELFLEEE
ncbi:GAF and ANTAR domain-containing protein [Amycolatopsis sp. w19]|uniref:GAF and ANTAR domain-containing protein n=1 Tax=Amycolatopsis sp. w19 TaxID=3448134 RepID=UPI003F1E2A20